MPEIPLRLQMYQIGLILISIGIDFSREKEERALFQKFHDYRESLTKFKDLVASGLSTNLVILSKEHNKELFRSDPLLEITQAKGCLEWLDELRIDRRSLTEGIAEGKEEKLSVLKLLREMKEEKITFQAQEMKEKRVYEVKIFGMKWDGEDAVGVMLHDITEHQLYLGLQAADQNKDKMLAMISHELKTPLNGILGVVNLLKKEIKDLQHLRFLTVCKNSGELLLNLVNSILDLKQIRDKTFNVQLAKDNLHELLANIYDLFKFQFDQKNLYFRLDISSEVPEQIITDQNRLRQILINLIGNALKFTFEGGVKVNVDLDPERKGYICFKVSDTGTGIKEEDMGKLFKMYGRLESHDMKAKNTRGVGLGLEISNQLAILLAKNPKIGGIKVQSKIEGEDSGSSFYFSIRDNNILIDEETYSFERTEEINYFEPKVFSENTEDIGLKISPYSHLRMITASNNDICSTQSVMPSTGFCVSNKQIEPQISPGSSGRRKLDRYQYRSLNTFYRGKGASAGSPVMPLKKEISNPESPGSNYALNLEIKARSFTKLQGEKQKILVVDDNPFNLLVARKIVENLGYTVETVLNGQKAIEEVKNVQVYSAILMDLQMPVMDGYEATKELRKMMVNKEITEIPIIAISANDTEDDKKRCKEAGMFDHLPKPLYEEKLRVVLGRALRRREYETSLEDIDELRWERAESG